MAWHDIALKTGTQSEVHCSELTAVFWNLDGADRCPTNHSAVVVDPGQD